MSASKTHQSVLYPRPKVKRWLASLARNMQRHDQTIFMIEQIQTSWLPSPGSKRLQRLITILASGMICSLVGGGIGLLVVWFSDLSFGELVPITLLIGFAWGIVISAILLIWRNEIKTNEGLLFSMKNMQFIKGLKKGLPRGLLLGFFISLLFYAFTRITEPQILTRKKADLQELIQDEKDPALLQRWTRELNDINLRLAREGSGFVLEELVVDVVIMTVAIGLIGILLSMLLNGIIRRVLETKTTPNEGIRETLKNATKWCWIFTLILAFIPYAILIPLDQIFHVVEALDSIRWYFAISLGSFLTLTGLWLWLGGIDVLNHFTLRWMIYFKRQGPFDYAHFLDYTSDQLQFTQRVGGGYIFIHRMLLEHFATMEVAKE